MEKNIKELQKQIHKNAVEKGFWDTFVEIEDQLDNYVEDGEMNEVMKLLKHRVHYISTKLCLVHSEVSEALEALRIDDMDNFREELADVVIRVMDMSEALGIDLEKEIQKKIEHNAGRAKMHGKAF